VTQHSAAQSLQLLVRAQLCRLLTLCSDTLQLCCLLDTAHLSAQYCSQISDNEHVLVLHLLQPLLLCYIHATTVTLAGHAGEAAAGACHNAEAVLQRERAA
jgi:hypothetical protein